MINTNHYFDIWHVASDYGHQLLKTLIDEYSTNPRELRRISGELMMNEPEPLALSWEHPDKDEAVQAYV
ncbi:hypothetical protein QZH41_017497, partial [Actinostola sp. cb2023]